MNLKAVRDGARHRAQTRSRESQNRAYDRARSGWASHHAANATLQLHLR